jgi:hypothetical protein
MVTIECPWCDDALTVDGGDSLRCDGCQVELEFAPDELHADVRLAA